MKKLQLTFNKKYLCSNRIGLGRSSEVYLAFQLATEKEIAIKLDAVFDKESTLERQAKFYRLVKGGTGIPNLYWFGIEHNFRALVTDVFGPSLGQLLKYCQGSFSLKTVLLIADQIFDRTEWVHSKGLVYNNVDPANFVVGLGEKQDKIFVVDLGNCQKYLDENGQHIAFNRQESSFIKWSQPFRSINSHTNKKTSRRDDLESIGYMLVYFFKNQLPWNDILDSETSDMEIKEKKMSVPIHLLCEGIPDEFQKYFEYVRTLQFEEEPDYVWIRRMFKDLFDRSGFTNNRVLDWAEKHKY